MRRNPAWVDKALLFNWSKLQTLVGQRWMPIRSREDVTGIESKLGREGPQFYEYGTGHYGTVMPTRDPDVVVKVTSDPSEAEIVAFTVDAARRERHGMPEGLVKYHRIQQLPGAYRKRPIYIIWREAAFEVGFSAIDHLDVDPRTKKEGIAYINRFKDAATYVREYLKKRPNGLPELERMAEQANAQDYPAAYATNDVQELRRLPHNLRWGTYYGSLSILAELLANTDGVYLIGKTFEYYLEHDVILADVHLNNVGLVHREGFHRAPLVITDPGHAIFLKQHEYQRPGMVANRR